MLALDGSRCISPAPAPPTQNSPRRAFPHRGDCALQEKSYFSLALPHGWWVFGLDLALVGDIDMCQYRYFANVVERRMGRDDQVILITHEPIWLLEVGWGDAQREGAPRPPPWGRAVCGWHRREELLCETTKPPATETAPHQAASWTMGDPTTIPHCLTLQWFWAHSSSSNLRQLVRGHLRGRARVHLAGDLHFYMRHSFRSRGSLAASQADLVGRQQQQQQKQQQHQPQQQQKQQQLRAADGSAYVAPVRCHGGGGAGDSADAIPSSTKAPPTSSTSSLPADYETVTSSPARAGSVPDVGAAATASAAHPSAPQRLRSGSGELEMDARALELVDSSSDDECDEGKWCLEQAASPPRPAAPLLTDSRGGGSSQTPAQLAVEADRRFAQRLPRLSLERQPPGSGFQAAAASADAAGAAHARPPVGAAAYASASNLMTPQTPCAPCVVHG